MNFWSDIISIQRLRDVHTGYEIALVEVAASLQLSRNILLALMALQSWKGFVRRWMKAYTLSYDAKAQLSVLDKTSKAASDILKVKIGLLSSQTILFTHLSVICIECTSLSCLI